MPPKRNPLKLNALQLKTLAILQELAGLPDCGRPDEAGGGTVLAYLPQPHGDHYHLGENGVSASNATGLRNPSVWGALARKGLVGADFADVLMLTAQGLAYDTGVRDKIVMRPDHET
ncbi:MAG: hypothetical protein IH905_03050 [Proteobacteria bacterium]|nr:hypothetical protein [Pseudomonadota bacterium]